MAAPGSESLNKVTFVTFENQRFWRTKFTDKTMPGERSSWSDAAGAMHLPKESFKLPGPEWAWRTTWLPDVNSDQTDEEGWMYAIDFNSPWSAKSGAFDVVRRRKWARVCLRS
jgi:hypothetical protein